MTEYQVLLVAHRAALAAWEEAGYPEPQPNPIRDYAIARGVYLLHMHVQPPGWKPREYILRITGDEDGAVELCNRIEDNGDVYAVLYGPNGPMTENS